MTEDDIKNAQDLIDKAIKRLRVLHFFLDSPNMDKPYYQDHAQSMMVAAYAYVGAAYPLVMQPSKTANDGKYGYSYDGVTFFGAEEDRDEAFTAAITEYTLTGEVIYTGRMEGIEVVDVQPRTVGA